MKRGRKQEKNNSDLSAEKAMTAKQQFKRKPPKCHKCGKFGHIKKNCRYSPTEVDDKRNTETPNKGLMQQV